MKKNWLSLFFCLLITSTSIVYAEDLTLTGAIPSGNHYINGSITTQGTSTVSTGVDLELIAQTNITFNPGFKVMAGGTLAATTSPDTDGDLILDLVEKRSGCQNPNLADTDEDGLTDSQEDKNKNGIHEPALNETNACDNDTDGDRIKDGWEVTNGLNPLVDDANEDPDGDKLTNYMEYYFNTSDPLDPNSLPPKGTYYEYDELGRIKKIIRVKKTIETY